jgi:hypothetical protein
MPTQLTRRTFVAGAPLALAACAAEAVWAPETDIVSARFSSSGPAALTLFTVKNAGSGNGAHTSLLVDASERVLFDPAGSFKATGVPERNDVLFGFSPAVESAYRSFHARTEFFMVIQQINVPPAVAEQALQLVKSNGAVPKANCTRATSRIISRLPGFDAIGTTWFPNNLSDDFANIPGVTTSQLREQD